MRIARYEAEGDVGHGIVEGDRIQPIVGTPFDAGLVARGPALALDAVRLLVPFEPRTFYAVGLNYREHVLEQAARSGRPPVFPPKPDVGYRAINALVAHGDDVVIPREASHEVQYEAELVVVIGREAKHLDAADALSCVLGYTIGNDVSERSWQREDRTLWRAKNTDTFKPMGPWIQTDLDLDALETRVRVNGKETIRFPTNAMLFGVETYIAAITRYVTLHSGDMIWMGTEGKSPDLVDGDVVSIDIDAIGTLENRFVREV